MNAAESIALQKRFPFPTRARYSGAVPADHRDAAPAIATTGTPQRAGADEFTPGQKIALLRLRGSAWSQAVVAHLERFGKADCDGADYRALAARELAVNKGSFHVLTQSGRWTADRIAMDLARAEGLHAVSYTPARHGAAASARCACGWSTYASAHVPGHMNTLHRHGRAHLQHVGQYVAGDEVSL